MTKKTTLERLIRSKDIEFHSYDKKLSTRLKDYGEYNWNLVKKITESSGNRIVISGKKLQDYLQEQKNTYHLTQFIVQLWSLGGQRFRPEGMNLHVDVNINNLEPFYNKPKEEKVVNGSNQKIANSSNWVPEMSSFEKTWNFALCNAIGGLIGFPGYEFPLNDKQFRYHVSEHAESFMIGTKEQLKRYEKYALEHLKKINEISDELKADPSTIFVDDYEKIPLVRIKNSADRAQRIAENVAIFSMDYNRP